MLNSAREWNQAAASSATNSGTSGAPRRSRSSGQISHQSSGRRSQRITAPSVCRSIPGARRGGTGLPLALDRLPTTLPNGVVRREQFSQSGLPATLRVEPLFQFHERDSSSADRKTQATLAPRTQAPRERGRASLGGDECEGEKQ